MEELQKLKLKLDECRRHSDNHRRSRDHFKETVAVLRKDNAELKQSVQFWIGQHERLDEAYVESRRHQEAWRTLSFLLFFFASIMSVLFFWAVRQ